jgi:hypothetical protein
MSERFPVRRKLAILGVLLLLSWGGKAHRLWAADYPHKQKESKLENLDSDENDSMDQGEDDDTSDDSTGKSEFKKDLDDTYEDTSVNDVDKVKSKFKEDQDDDDQETDESDEGPDDN